MEKKRGRVKRVTDSNYPLTQAEWPDGRFTGSVIRGFTWAAFQTSPRVLQEPTDYQSGSYAHLFTSKNH